MKALTQSDFHAWCEQRGLQVKGRGILNSQSISIVLRIPDKTRGVLSLVCELFPKDEPFAGGLFWAVDTGSLSDDIIDLGLTIQTLMRRGYGLSTVPDAPFSKEPACLFDQGERLQAQGFLAQLLLFSWGGYFVPDHAQYFFFINPDGVLEVVTESDRWIDFFSAFSDKMGIRQHGRWIG